MFSTGGHRPKERRARATVPQQRPAGTDPRTPKGRLTQRKHQRAPTQGNLKGYRPRATQPTLLNAKQTSGTTQKELKQSMRMGHPILQDQAKNGQNGHNLETSKLLSIPIRNDSLHTITITHYLIQLLYNIYFEVCYPKVIIAS